MGALQALAPASACLQLALTVKVTPGSVDRRVLGYAIRSVDCTQCVERNQEKHWETGKQKKKLSKGTKKIFFLKKKKKEKKREMT